MRCDNPLSLFAFNFNLRPYTKAAKWVRVVTMGLVDNSSDEVEKRAAINARYESNLRAGDYMPKSPELMTRCYNRLSLLCRSTSSAMCAGSKENDLKSRHTQAREEILHSAAKERESLVERICFELEQQPEGELDGTAAAARPRCVITGFNRVHRSFSYASYNDADNRGGIDYQLQFTREETAQHIPHDLYYFRNRIGDAGFAPQIARRIPGRCALGPNQSLLSLDFVKNKQGLTLLPLVPTFQLNLRCPFSSLIPQTTQLIPHKLSSEKCGLESVRPWQRGGVVCEPA